MRVVIAPGRFGDLGPVEAADAIASGWQRRCPLDRIDRVPQSDGGRGFAGVIGAAQGGQWHPVQVTGPMREPVAGSVLLVEDPDDGIPTGYVEAAQADALELVAPADRDPLHATSWGVGELVDAALALGARRVVVGVGESATNDGGVGLLAALGAVLRDTSGRDISSRAVEGAVILDEVASVDLEPVRSRVAGVELVAASGSDSPLLGPRGASLATVRSRHSDPERVLEVELHRWEARLAAFAALVGRGPDGRDPAVALGAAAGGGLAYALLALGGGHAQAIGLVAGLTGLEPRLADADLVVTGQEVFDWQSLRGSIVSAVAAAGLDRGLPAVALAGQVEVGRREYTAMGVSAAFALAAEPGGDRYAELAGLGERVAGTWGGAGAV